MARSGGYMVLAKYPSSSSDKIYEVRRGGDGVLYCVCQGWVSNLNANRRSGSRQPAACKHTKAYVAKHPSTPYVLGVTDPAIGVAAATVTLAKQVKPAKQPIVSAPAVAPAPANWREVLLKEAAAAEARGVQTPATAKQEFMRELEMYDLGPTSEVTTPTPIAVAPLDMDD